MLKSKVVFGLVVCVAMSLYSCDSNKVYEEYMEIEGANWKKEQVANFEFSAKDTLTPHNLYLNIRNTGDYAYSNLYLFVTLKGPNGNLLRDTVNCILADNSGRWKGSGVGDLWDLQFPYLGGFKFAQTGTYQFSLEQAMRVEDGLQGITDIGLRIEKAD